MDVYQVLGLEGGGPHVLQAAIRKAYRARALVLHPDKRGNDPVAAAEFQKLQKAYEILNDEKARAAFDELLRVRKERFEKENKQSEKRRKMLNDLKEKERAHELDRKFKVEEEQASVRLKAEIARIRKAQAKKRNGESPSFEFAKPQASAQVPAASASEMEKTLKASWTCLEGGGSGYSAARLREIFEEFGQVEDIALRQSKSKKKSSALIVMSSKEAAIAATERQCGDLSNPLLVVPAMPLGTTPVNTEKAEMKLVGAGFRSYEDLTLRKMRQAAERARLEKQMREEDEKVG